MHKFEAMFDDELQAVYIPDLDVWLYYGVWQGGEWHEDDEDASSVCISEELFNNLKLKETR